MQDKPKYRTRKGTIAMNVLGACTPNMEFTYVLPGWEGSAHDGRVLRDAISRPNGLKVPQGNNCRVFDEFKNHYLLELISNTVFSYFSRFILFGRCWIY